MGGDGGLDTNDCYLGALLIDFLFTAVVGSKQSTAESTVSLLLHASCAVILLCHRASFVTTGESVLTITQSPQVTFSLAHWCLVHVSSVKHRTVNDAVRTFCAQLHISRPPLTPGSHCPLECLQGFCFSRMACLEILQHTAF